MEKTSEKKVDIINFLIGIPSPIWVKAYSLTLSFSDDMVKELVEEGKEAADLMKLSGKTMPAMEVNFA